jgi:hypothetical protein
MGPTGTERQLFAANSGNVTAQAGIEISSHAG